MEFSHIDGNGDAHMVDVSLKGEVKRTAVAEGTVTLSMAAAEMLKESLDKKGDALGAARIAGIQAAKRTYDLIPLCHQLLLNCVDVGFEVENNNIHISSTVVCMGKTGVEMEALTAVSVAALTLYDMCKAVDKSIVITGIKLTSKKKEEI